MGVFAQVHRQTSVICHRKRLCAIALTLYAVGVLPSARQLIESAISKYDTASTGNESNLQPRFPEFANASKLSWQYSSHDPLQRCDIYPAPPPVGLATHTGHGPIITLNVAAYANLLPRFRPTTSTLRAVAPRACALTCANSMLLTGSGCSGRSLEGSRSAHWACTMWWQRYISARGATSWVDGLKT